MQSGNSLENGDLVGDRYRIVRQVGQGGMGAVYLAEDIKLPGKQWAVKEIRMHVQQKEVFLDEAQVLSRLDHPFLPHIIDFFPPTDNGFCYLVIDFVQGRTLSDVFQTERSFAAEKVVRYAIQLCEVFEYLHNFRPRPIIYRDLKPSNVMVDEQDNIRLIDFGIARHYSLERIADTVHLGTVGFAAPEQFGEKQTDPRTDLYTLGAVMYYLLSGGHYYRPGAETLGELRADLPPGLGMIISKLLQADPENRYQTAAQVKTALLPIQSSSAQHPMTEQLVRPAHSAVEAKHRMGVSFQRRVIIIGGLYDGAGTTFTALSLARVLNKHRVRQAVVELPGAAPELYHLLDGERELPTNYRFPITALEETAGTGDVKWRDGFTEWIPLPPDAPCGAGDADLFFRLLHLLPQPLVIVDAGSRWSDPAIQELCLRSDMTIAVGGPDPAKLASAKARRGVDVLNRLYQSGKHVEILANRDCRFAGRSEWLSSLPQEPVALLPDLPQAGVLESLWKGKAPQDKPEYMQLLERALKPLIRKLIPELHMEDGKRKWAFFAGRR